MNKSYKHIVALSLMVLLLFSTIGFQIITTFCGGCNDEHVSVAVIQPADSNLACECCNQTDGELICCTSTNNNHETHHQSTSKFAKLSIDATEAKTPNTGMKEVEKTLNYVFLSLHLFSNYLKQLIPKNRFYTHINAERTVLSKTCVLLN